MTAETVVALITLVNFALTSYVVVYMRALRAELKAEVLREVSETYATKEGCNLRHMQHVRSAEVD